MDSSMSWCRVLWLVLMTCVATLLIVLIVQGPRPPIDAAVFQPPLRSIPVLHLDDASYTDLTGIGDVIWSSLVPRNRGYVLATNLTSGLHFWSDVALFHQLRCLILIRKSLMDLAKVDAAKDHLFASGAVDAVGSCFDYLRQVSRTSTSAQQTVNADENFRSPSKLM